MSGWQFIQNPGPTNMPEEVLAALGRRAVEFGAAPFTELVAGCLADLGRVFDVAEGGEVFVHTASGHGGWEAALVNLFEPGQRVLVPDCGRFSLTWGNMAQDLGLEVQWLASDWRRAVSPEAVHDALAADGARTLAGVLLIHTETSTGVTNDAPALAEAVQASGHPALVVLDAVASLGTTTLSSRAFDAVVAASQKGLMLAPGLALVAAGPRAVERAETIRSRRSYWAWPERNEADIYRQFCGTPPVQLVFALRAGLDLLLAEGLEQVIARHHRLADGVRAAVAHWCGPHDGRGGGLDFYATNPQERADSVTCVRLAQGHDPREVRRRLREEWNVTVGGGLDRLAEDTFRIGHLGSLNGTMVLGVLAAIEGVLSQCQIPHAAGGVNAALSHFVQTSTSPLSGVSS